MTDVSDIRARLDAATPRPWTMEQRGEETIIWGALPHGEVCSVPVAQSVTGEWGDSPDCALIAHAPEDIRRLLDTLDQIRSVLADEPDPCPEHDDADPITCGWKRDITRIKNIIEGEAK